MKLYGAHIVYILDTDIGPIYLIGEMHDFQSEYKCNIGNLLDLLKQQSDIEIFVELDSRDVFYIVKNVPNPCTPIPAIAHYIYTGNEKCVHSIDVRRRPPFHLIESLLSFEGFLRTNYQIDAFPAFSEINKIRKTFEKDLFKAIDSRKKSFEFLNSLVNPTKNLPAWYIKSLHNMESVGLRYADNPIHSTLIKLPDNDRNSIIQLADYHWQKLIDNEHYSAAVKSMERTRKSSSKNAVFEKYPDLIGYFSSVFSILMDVFVIGTLLREKKPTPRIVVAGSAHITRIFQFLNNNEKIKSAKYGVMENNEYIDLNQLKVLPIVKRDLQDAVAVLPAFRKRKH